MLIEEYCLTGSLHNNDKPSTLTDQLTHLTITYIYFIIQFEMLIYFFNVRGILRRVGQRCWVNMNECHLSKVQPLLTYYLRLTVSQKVSLIKIKILITTVTFDGQVLLSWRNLWGLACLKTWTCHSKNVLIQTFPLYSLYLVIVLFVCCTLSLQSTWTLPLSRSLRMILRSPFTAARWSLTSLGVSFWKEISIC